MALNSAFPPILDLVQEGERWIRQMVQGDASYPTGGYPVPASVFGLNTFMRQKLGGGSGVGSQMGSGVDRVVFPVVIELTRNVETVFNAQINISTGNLQFFTAAGAEVANAVDVHLVQVVLEAFGH